MRTAWTSILASALCAVAATSLAAPPQLPQQENSQKPSLDARQLQEVGRMTPDEAQSLVTIFFPKFPPQSLESDIEIAGLPTGSRPDLLNWESVYTLALVRARSGASQTAEVLDTKVLRENAERNSVADFRRFRQDFLAVRTAAGEGFRDPSGAYIDLLRRLQIIDNARCAIARQENTLTLYREFIKGESSGLSALDVDLVEATVIRAKEILAAETAHFRDGLDELKAALGLAPRAPVIPDRQGIAAFREVFEGVNNWHRDPKRTLDVLAKLIARLPALGEVVVEGQPILGAIEANPSRLGDVLATATRVANQNRQRSEKGAAAQGKDVQLELRTSRRIRRLVEARRAYDSEKRRFELTNRVIEELLEQLVAPPAGGTQALAQSARAAFATTALLSQSIQLQRAEDRLVDLWASFKGERLALYRDLGVLPYDDWKSFYDDLTPRLGPGN